MAGTGGGGVNNRPLGLLSPLALAFGVVAPGVIALGLFGFKYGWLSWPVAEFLFTKAPSPLALAAVALGVVAAVLGLFARPRRGLVLALLAIVLGAGTYAVIAAQNAQAAKFPPIHDVSTGWDAPPMPTATLATARDKEGAFPADKQPVVDRDSVIGIFSGRTVAEVNAETCKAAVPITLTEPPNQAFAAALKAVQDRGLQVVSTDRTQGAIDATATNFWGMKDDVMVRVRAEGAGARIDIRSISRHGLNDRGHNCRRVDQLRAALAGG